MSWRVDARVPVRMLRELPKLDGKTAVLAENTEPDLPAQIARAVFTLRDAPHPVACTCCQGQGAAAAALAALFRARATGGPWFDQVVALVSTDEGEAEITQALTKDILTVARYKPA